MLCTRWDMKIEPYFSSLGVRLHILFSLLSLHLLSLREKTLVKILIQPVSVRGKAAELDKRMV